MASNKKIRLNLGSGLDYQEGFINVDVNTENKVDVVADLSKPFPFENDSADEIKASDILEHFTKEDGEKFIRQCHRVLKTHGTIFIRTHNIFKIFENFSNDPQVLIHFLYGDTKDTDVFGSHKYAYTKESISLLLRKVGFIIKSIKIEQTNFEVIAEKVATPNKKLSIGIIMQSPDMGGAEKYMLSLISEFLKKGNKIILSSNKGKFFTEASKYPVKTYEIPIVMDIIGNGRGLAKTIFFLPYSFLFYLNLLRKFKKENVDIILMSNFTEKLFVTLLSPIFKIPVVWIEYGRLESVFRKNLYLPKFIYMLLKNIPKKIIVPTTNTLQGLITEAKVSLAKIKVVNLGTLIPTEYRPSKRIIPEWENNIVIGSVSRLTREKGQEYLIKAMPHILQKNSNVRLLIIGDGPDREYFMNLVKSLGLKDKVELTGFVKNLEEYYKAIDIFVFPSTWELEGFGLVLVEAMANKIPVVANRFGPSPEIVVDGKTGILTNPGSEKSIAGGVIKLSLNPSIRREMGEKGYERAKNLYDIKASSQKVLDELYEATLSD